VTATIRGGGGGHGALACGGGAVACAADALRRLEERRLPVRVTPVVRMMLEAIAAELPRVRAALIRQLLHPRMTDRVLDVAGDAAAPFDPMLHNTVSVTGLRAGSGGNVVPSEVTIDLDGRMVPGCRPDDLLAELRDLVGADVELQVRRYDGGPDRVDLGLFRMLDAVIGDQDSGARAVPMLMPAGSDGRFFSRLGIQPYGFLPMRLPESLAFSRLIHAVDERIPVDAVEFGTRALRQVLDRFDDVDDGRIGSIA
jgi:acetylornithine deacetylase/succinyl-diaminopimelate desuccinylase-like protein